MTSRNQNSNTRLNWRISGGTESIVWLGGAVSCPLILRFLPLRT